MTATKIQNFGDLALDMVTSAYSGKDGKCCCGCSGKHYHRYNMKDYRGGGTENDRRQIRRIYSIIEHAGMIENGGGHFSTVIDGRLYIVYHEEGK